MSLLPPPEQPKTPKGASSPSLPSSMSGASGTPSPKPSALPAAAAKAEAVASSVLSSLRVSLMPSDLEGRPAPNITKGLVILAIVVLIETAIVGGLYFIAGRSVSSTVAERDKLEADITRIDKETASLEAAATPAVSYAYQLQAAKETLGTHVYWSPFFAFLEKNTLPTVKYLNFSGDSSTGTVTVDCIAGTYHDVAEQIVSLRETPMVLDVRSNSAAAKVNEKGEITGISFSMVIKVKPEAWTLVTEPSSMPDQQGSGTSATTGDGQPPAFQAVPTQPSATTSTTAPAAPASETTGTPTPSPAAPNLPPSGEGQAPSVAVPGAVPLAPPAPPAVP